MSTEPFLKRVKIHNYKSIGDCDVELGRFTLLVGRNGSGKSNFLDALRFITDGLQTSLEHAIKARGGIDAVRRRSTGHPHNFQIEVTLALPNWIEVTYGFEIAAKTKGTFAVKRELLRFTHPNGDNELGFDVREGKVEVPPTKNSMPPAVSDRLYLVTAAGLPEFRPVYDALASMGFYNLNPEEMKEVQSPDAGELLRRDGGNIASVVGRMVDDQPTAKQRVVEYLKQIIPDIVDFERKALGHRETLEFHQRVKGSIHPWHFYAASMSDGTLRALGTLVAVMQLADREHPIQLVGIEEPETALHPAAAGALADALREASLSTQVLLTTHSPDLLDQFDAATDDLLVVQACEGVTQIGPADPASQEAIRTHLYTPGELLRMDQLRPQTASEQQLPLTYGGDGAEA